MPAARVILLADDDARDVELTLTALSGLDLPASVVVVRDGVELLAYLRGEGAFRERSPGRLALVILDVKMPRKDGLEALAEIRSDPVLRSTPVVVLTSSQLEHDVATSHELGVSAYVVKPVEFARYVEVVRHIGALWGRLAELRPEPKGEA